MIPHWYYSPEDDSSPGFFERVDTAKLCEARREGSTCSLRLGDRTILGRSRSEVASLNT